MSTQNLDEVFNGDEMNGQQNGNATSALDITNRNGVPYNIQRTGESEEDTQNNDMEKTNGDADKKSTTPRTHSYQGFLAQQRGRRSFVSSPHPRRGSGLHLRKRNRFASDYQEVCDFEDEIQNRYDEETDGYSGKNWTTPRTHSRQVRCKFESPPYSKKSSGVDFAKMSRNLSDIQEVCDTENDTQNRYNEETEGDTGKKSHSYQEFTEHQPDPSSFMSPPYPKRGSRLYFRKRNRIASDYQEACDAGENTEFSDDEIDQEDSFEKSTTPRTHLRQGFEVRKPVRCMYASSPLPKNGSGPDFTNENRKQNDVQKVCDAGTDSKFEDGEKDNEDSGEESTTPKAHLN